MRNESEQRERCKQAVNKGINEISVLRVGSPEGLPECSGRQGRNILTLGEARWIRNKK